MHSDFFPTSIPLKRDKFYPLQVSTVDTSDEGYETAIIDLESTYPVERYNSKKEAIKGHKKWCKNINKIKKDGIITVLGSEQYNVKSYQKKLSLKEKTGFKDKCNIKNIIKKVKEKKAQTVCFTEHNKKYINLELSFDEYVKNVNFILNENVMLTGANFEESETEIKSTYYLRCF